MLAFLNLGTPKRYSASGETPISGNWDQNIGTYSGVYFSVRMYEI